jgi:SAM-dependent MidA family methyltransferase
MSPYQRLCHHILQQPRQRISFAEYMDWALYDPQDGYYTCQVDAIGSQGDFFTSSHLCADFGELIGEQLAQMWERLGRWPKADGRRPVGDHRRPSTPFTLVEMGAGRGLLAADILHTLQSRYPDCFAGLRYWIVERSPQLQEIQKHQLQSFNLGDRLQWFDWQEIPLNSIVGCCFSNELIDAFPVHQVTVQGGQLQEVYVSVSTEDSSSNPMLVPVLGELSTPELLDYFTALGIDLTASPYPEGYCTEVNLAALNWLKLVGDRLQKGYLLTIDYGYTAPRYYHPNRNQGTLQCYYRHAHHNNPYINLGQQDITAHVNFTALQQWGERVGLKTIEFTQQAVFLMALGLGDRLAQLSTESRDPQVIQHTLRRRDALHQLINPMGLGNFGVLIQGKGLSDVETQPFGQI